MFVSAGLRRSFAAIALCAAVSTVTAYDPPAGAFFLPSISTPWGAASTPTVTGGDAPWASNLNPSAQAGSQMNRIEAAYSGITDYGTGTQGWGSAASLAFSLPQAYGVWGGSARFFSQAPGMTDMPLGTYGALRAFFAKDLFPKWYAGAALGVTMGGSGGFGWGLGMDLGITHLPGDLGPFKDFRWGLTVSDIGKGYSTPLPASGAFGTPAPTSYPSAFTLGLGARGYLIRSYDWNLDLALDLRSPSFQDLDLGISTSLGFRDFASVRVGWTLGLRDLIEGSGRSLLPSVGIAGTIPLDGGVKIFGTQYRDAELGVSVATAPLYGDLWSLGAGASLGFGLKDRTAPLIEAQLPVPFRGTMYISPNGDGIKDNLEIPVKVTEDRYLTGWVFRIEDRSAGKVVRTIGDELARPEAFTGLESLVDAAKYSRKTLSVPSVLVWDGNDDSGRRAPDGSYLVSIEAWDDNGNHNIDYINCMVVVVDTVQPQAGLSVPGGSLIFSPDGDGSKDALALRLSGSPEKLWKLEVKDSGGKTVRSEEYRDSAPPDFAWDGTADDGKRVADDSYTLSLSTMDDSGNEARRSVRDVIVDTRRPEVTLSLESYAMSPNGDGIKDSLKIGTSVASFDGLESWNFFIMDSARKEVWSASGTGANPPAAAYDFGGYVGGKVLPDGYYEAGLELAYVNGYKPQRIGEPFLLDSTPPSAEVGLADANVVFSPDGDSLRDQFAFTFQGSKEDLWMLEIRNARNEAVRLVEFSGELPAQYLWDGRDGEGRTAADGEYSAFLWSMDKAGNSGSARSSALRIDTRRPALRLSIDRDAFSPNGDGKADSLGLSLASESKDGLSTWKLWVEPASGGTELWSASGSGLAGLKDAWTFAGKDSRGVTLPEGKYRARVALEYVSGYAPSAQTPDFSIDVSYPSGNVVQDRAAFNPSGDERQSRVVFTQSGSAEESWTGELRDASGVTARRWDFGSALPAELSWDGAGESGAALSDGTYSYILKSTDRAGNAFASAPVSVLLDTKKKQAILLAEPREFSPNGDGAKDSLSIAASSTASEGSAGWLLSLRAQEAAGLASGETVRSWSGKGRIPASFLWDGVRATGVNASDGLYSADLRVEYPNGDVAEAAASGIILDRTAPEAKVSVAPALFSPNGDGRSDVAEFAQSSAPGDEWAGRILSSQGTVVRSYSWKGDVASFVWDGTDQAGNPVGDGTYSYELTSTDAAGNAFAAPVVKVAVETEKKAVKLDVDQRAFSPNGDGVKDILAMTPTVQSPERVRRYELSILAQEGPAAFVAVRTWKGDAGMPARFVWDGKTDSGIPAPDGRYAASLVILYSNDDRVEGGTPAFLLDTVAPKIEASVEPALFSPNGDGRSDTVRITQKALPGDDWTGRMIAADGRTVKTWAWRSQVASFDWDGRGDSGNLLADGSYIYEIASTDAAGNRGSNEPRRSVEIETQARSLRLSADQKAFSPNGDAVKDSLVLSVQAAAVDRLQSWELKILSADASPAGAAQAAGAVRSWRGGTDLAANYVWDGRTDSGIPAPDGSYRAVLDLKYRNDDRISGSTGEFLVDRVAPQVHASASPELFSPNGDGRSDVVRFTQESVPGDDWTGVVLGEDGNIVRSWTWKNKVEDFSWDGRDQAGNLLGNGVYAYRISSVDLAGNASSGAGDLLVTLETGARTVRLSVDQKAFSPNGDGIKDQLIFNVQASTVDRIESFELAVTAANASGSGYGSAVRVWRGKEGLQEQYQWDGKTDSGIAVPDGNYLATLTLRYLNDDFFQVRAPVVTLDTVAPKASARAEPLLFSPNGDGNRDSLAVTQTSTPGDDWTGKMLAANGSPVRTWTWKGEAKSFSWNGKDDSGQSVRDGSYSYELVSADAAGNRTSVVVPGIVVDATAPKVYVTASDTGISPNDDGVRDEVSFTLVTEKRDGIDMWRFSLLDRDGKERSFFGGSGEEVPARLVWDGRDLQGQVIQGDYTGKLVVRYLKGDVAQASSQKITVKVDPPKVDLTVEPEYFSPDGDGVDDMLSIGITVDNPASVVDWKLEILETAIVESAAPGAVGGERLFKEWSGKGAPPERIAWDGKSARNELVESATDYPFRFTARDALGNSTKVSGLIAVDVLVLRDGDRLKIKVPSIVFRANYADFVGLDSETVARNRRVVARIAEILNKFPDYKIRIEGHANNVGKMLGYSSERIQNEEIKELVPLSTGRAELVRGMLVQNGVDARRLSVKGLGSSEPVVSFTDVENRWKNRRVEFILIKNP